MLIKGDDFILNPVSESSPFYDLDLLKVIKPKGGESREEFKTDAYGCTLESALIRIIRYRLSKKQDIYLLKEYLDEFKKIKEELLNICLEKKN